MLNDDQFIAANSMLTIISPPASIRRVDERLFEGLLVLCLSLLPELEKGLGLPVSTPDSRYRLGGRGFPDVVRHSALGHYEIGIEVKLRSAHNLQRRNTADPRWQLDVYADHSSERTELFVIAPDSKRTLLNSEFDGYDDPLFENRARWRFITTESVGNCIAAILGDQFDPAAPAARLVSHLARATAH